MFCGAEVLIAGFFFFSFGGGDRGVEVFGVGGEEEREVGKGGLTSSSCRAALSLARPRRCALLEAGTSCISGCGSRAVPTT
jgi:hypothetical protein